MAENPTPARRLRPRRAPAAQRNARAAGILGVAGYLALLLCLANQPAHGADEDDPLSRINGTYSGTIEWSADRSSARPSTGNGLIEPVLRPSATNLSIAVLRGDGAARISWTYDGETLEAWIDGTIGAHAYRAPRGAELLCRPTPTQVRSAAHASELWLSCEPPGAPGTAPRVLMALAAIDKTRNVSAEWLFLRFKHYENKYQVLWENADALLRHQPD